MGMISFKPGNRIYTGWNVTEKPYLVKTIAAVRNQNNRK
jgi:hypothetical protein